MHFDSDYLNLCHPLILKRMEQIYSASFPGYGADSITRSARERIRALTGCPEAGVWFLAGGTQTNMVVIDALLRSWEGVICAGSGHIAVHEAGAVEFTGHKVLTLPQEKDANGIPNGKISAGVLQDYLRTFYSDPNWEHTVIPGMVYITHPTECGSVYTLQELESLSAVCRERNIPLYIDGARLGYGLAADTARLREGETLPSLRDIARLADAFYIGGTKCGAMMGEAVVFPRPDIAPHFFTQIKRHGALLAKGWVAATQFDVLMSAPDDTDNPDSPRIADAARMEDTLYYRICRHGVKEAMRLRDALVSKGYRLMPDCPTNQLFVEISTQKADSLSRHLTFGQWEPPHGDKLTIRFATSWATAPQDIDRLIALL